jgi:hypothetical protein
VSTKPSLSPFKGENLDNATAKHSNGFNIILKQLESFTQLAEKNVLPINWAKRSEKVCHKFSAKLTHILNKFNCANSGTRYELREKKSRGKNSSASIPCIRPPEIRPRIPFIYPLQRSHSDWFIYAVIGTSLGFVRVSITTHSIFLKPVHVVYYSLTEMCIYSGGILAAGGPFTGKKGTIFEETTGLERASTIRIEMFRPYLKKQRITCRQQLFLEKIISDWKHGIRGEYFCADRDHCYAARAGSNALFHPKNSVEAGAESIHPRAHN